MLKIREKVVLQSGRNGLTCWGIRTTLIFWAERIVWERRAALTYGHADMPRHLFVLLLPPVVQLELLHHAVSLASKRVVGAEAARVLPRV